MENKNTDRLVIVHNPNSTRAAQVGRTVFDVLNRNNIAYTEHLTRSDNMEVNIDEMASRFDEAKKRGEKITAINVGGDGTYLHMANAALRSGVEATLGSTRGGNFADGVRMYDSQSIIDLLKAKTVQTYPLEVAVDGQHLYYAPNYVTAGWTAGVAAQFGDPRSRELMKAVPDLLRQPLRLGQVLGNYVKNSRTLLPPFRIDGAPELHTNATDIMIANNSTVAQIVKFPVDYGLESDVFGVNTDIKVSDKVRSAMFAVRAVRGQTPHRRAHQLNLSFENGPDGRPVEIPLQADGEATKLRAGQVSVGKSAQNSLTVLDARL